jgi:hypothetical protein
MTLSSDNPFIDFITGCLVEASVNEGDDNFDEILRDDVDPLSFPDETIVGGGFE